MNRNLAKIVMQRLEALGQISDDPAHLTRTFCSPAMRRANDLVGSWMREAGMAVREDAIGNLIGRYAESPESGVQSLKSGIQSPESGVLSPGSGVLSPGSGVLSPKSKVLGPEPPARDAKVLLLGSHLDTVRDAGKFDGPLGVLTAIACVQRLHDAGTRLPFAIEVVGFADEEGGRYQSTYLGSKVLAGTFNRDNLNHKDADGVTMAEAIRNFGGNPEALAGAKLDRDRLLGYVEVH